MEWTREKRYLPYQDWDADTLMHLQAQAAEDQEEKGKAKGVPSA